jgi:hypothetical protein
MVIETFQILCVFITGTNECSTDKLGRALELDSIMTVTWLSE